MEPAKRKVVLALMLASLGLGGGITAAIVLTGDRGSKDLPPTEVTFTPTGRSVAADVTVPDGLSLVAEFQCEEERSRAGEYRAVLRNGEIVSEGPTGWFKVSMTVQASGRTFAFNFEVPVFEDTVITDLPTEGTTAAGLSSCAARISGPIAGLELPPREQTSENSLGPPAFVLRSIAEDAGCSFRETTGVPTRTSSPARTGVHRRAIEADDLSGNLALGHVVFLYNELRGDLRDEIVRLVRADDERLLVAPEPTMREQLRILAARASVACDDPNPRVLDLAEAFVAAHGGQGS